MESRYAQERVGGSCCGDQLAGTAADRVWGIVVVVIVIVAVAAALFFGGHALWHPLIALHHPRGN